MMQLRGQGDSCQTISRKTGVKYNIVYREVGHAPRPIFRASSPQASPTPFQVEASYGPTSTSFEEMRGKARRLKETYVALERSKHRQGTEHEPRLDYWQKRLREEQARQEHNKLTSPEFAKNQELRQQIETYKLLSQLSTSVDQFKAS